MILTKFSLGFVRSSYTLTSLNTWELTVAFLFCIIDTLATLLAKRTIIGLGPLFDGKRCLYGCLQNFLRVQSTKSKYNMVCETLQFLDCICGSTTGGLGLLGLYINENNTNLINQALETLTEYCQGPCHENQVLQTPSLSRTCFLQWLRISGVSIEKCGENYDSSLLIPRAYAVREPKNSDGLSFT